MNLLKQLEAAKPWGGPVVCRNHNNHNTGPANAAKAAQAWEKYKAAIGDGWASTRDVECRLGVGRSCVFKVLAKYYERRWLARRPAGGGEFNKRKGWEWKCVK
jgi:hypothetical protein